MFYSTAKASVYATLPRFFNGTGHRITGNVIDKFGADRIVLLQQGAQMVCDNLEANWTDDTAYMPKIALGLVWSPHHIILQAFKRASYKTYPDARMQKEGFSILAAQVARHVTRSKLQLLFCWSLGVPAEYWILIPVQRYVRANLALWHWWLSGCWDLWLWCYCSTLFSGPFTVTLRCSWRFARRVQYML